MKTSGNKKIIGSFSSVVVAVTVTVWKQRIKFSGNFEIWIGLSKSE